MPFNPTATMDLPLSHPYHVGVSNYLRGDLEINVIADRGYTRGLLALT